MKRSPRNPILTREDIPEVPGRLADVTSVFNPGAVKDGDHYRLMLRVQARSRETFLMMAASRTGIRFRVEPRIVELPGIERVSPRLHHVYDPRLTWIEGVCHVMFAADTDDGCKLGVARTRDFEAFEFLGLTDDRDVRNGVLFPQRFAGRYLRLARPNLHSQVLGPASGDTIVLAESDDLLRWRARTPVLHGRPRYWDERIGSGPPPFKTRDGWLHLYHGVATHFQSVNIYQVGVMLLDLDDPSIVRGRSRHNLLEPRESYELIGQVPNVVFPSGLVVDDCDGDGFARPESRVLVYYGAADTSVALATVTVGELLAACREPPL